MYESPPSPEESSVHAPAGPADQPTDFEPAFRAVQELFQARLREAKSRIDPMDQGLEESYKRYSDARMDYGKRIQRLFINAGLLRPTGGPVVDRSGFLDLLDKIGTPEARAMATALRLEDEWKRRGEPEDKDLEKADDNTVWAVGEQILTREGLFEPEARRQMLGESRMLRAKHEKLAALHNRMTTEMRRMILFSMRERDFNELDELFK